MKYIITLGANIEILRRPDTPGLHSNVQGTRDYFALDPAPIVARH